MRPCGCLLLRRGSVLSCLLPQRCAAAVLHKLACRQQMMSTPPAAPHKDQQQYGERKLLAMRQHWWTQLQASVGARGWAAAEVKPHRLPSHRVRHNLAWARKSCTSMQDCLGAAHDSIMRSQRVLHKSCTTNQHHMGQSSICRVTPHRVSLVDVSLVLQQQLHAVNAALPGCVVQRGHAVL